MRADDERYFERLEAGLEDALSVARRARERGGDPSADVEIPIAKDMADRVENILDIDGVAERVREMEADPDLSREEAALELAADFADGTVGDYDTRAGKVEGAVRTAVALLTEGVVAAPIEGIDRVGHVPGDGNLDVGRRVAAPLSGRPGDRQRLLEAGFEPLEVPLVVVAHLQRPEVEVGRVVVLPLEAGVELPDVEFARERRGRIEVAAQGGAVLPGERDVGVGEAFVLETGDVPDGGGHLERFVELDGVVFPGVLVVKEERRVLDGAQSEEEGGVDSLPVGERLDLSAPVPSVFEAGHVLAAPLDALIIHVRGHAVGHQKRFARDLTPARPLAGSRPKETVGKAVTGRSANAPRPAAPRAIEGCRRRRSRPSTSRARPRPDRVRR